MDQFMYESCAKYFFLQFKEQIKMNRDVHAISISFLLKYFILLKKNNNYDLTCNLALTINISCFLKHALNM